MAKMLKFSGLSWDQIAWSLFDAGCWGYASVTISTLVPLVFKQDTPKTEDLDVSAVWANAVAVGTLAAGVLCPFLGAIVDVWSARKITVILTSLSMIVFFTLFAAVDGSQWVLLIIVAVIAVMFYSVMQAVYNSLIVHVTEASEDELAYLSAVQCAIGNGGAMLLMSMLGLEDAKHSGAVIPHAYVLRSFIISGVWFAVLAAPLLIYFREPTASHAAKQLPLSQTIRNSFSSFKQSLRNRELMKYMLATLLYSDCSATLFSVYMVFGSQVGISNHVLLHCAVLNRWMGVFMGFGWYFICKCIGARMCFLCSISLTLLSAVACSLVYTDLDFFVTNVMLAMAGSGGYIFSRVLLARLTTKSTTSQHFGFMAGVSRVSGLIGPVLYGVLVLLAGPRTGLCGLAVLGTIGLTVMATVDFDVGQQCSQSTPIEDAVSEV